MSNEYVAPRFTLPPHVTREERSARRRRSLFPPSGDSHPVRKSALASSKTLEYFLAQIYEARVAVQRCRPPRSNELLFIPCGLPVWEGHILMEAWWHARLVPGPCQAACHASQRGSPPSPSCVCGMCLSRGSCHNRFAAAQARDGIETMV